VKTTNFGLKIYIQTTKATTNKRTKNSEFTQPETYQSITQKKWVYNHKFCHSRHRQKKNQYFAYNPKKLLLVVWYIYFLYIPVKKHTLDTTFTQAVLTRVPKFAKVPTTPVENQHK
jgi:hypothetical protein